MKAPNYVLLASLLLLGPPAGVGPEAEAVAAEAPAAEMAAEGSQPGRQVPTTAAPERSGKRRETLESFSPTEQVPAGSAISFPVDI